MPDIFSDINSANVASYWSTLTQQEAPYIGDVLFPSVKQNSKEIKFYKGQTSAPVALAASAFDAKTKTRDRNGFSEIKTETHFFKEGQYIDEALRQQLIQVSNSPIPAQRDAILNHIFNDSTTLLRAASLTRELMRMEMLRTGKYTFKSNGQSYTEDFEMKDTHKAKSAKSWDKDGNPLDDMDAAITTVTNDSGLTPTRVLMNRKTFNALISNETVKSTLLANNANTAMASVQRSMVLSYLSTEYGLTIQVYDKGYQVIEDGKAVMKKFIPDGQVVFMPDGDLGKTVFSPTPEEIDLLASSAADVSIVDTGVAITTTKLTDPVTTETRVSQMVAPTFEMIDGVYVLDTGISTPSQS